MMYAHGFVAFILWLFVIHLGTSSNKEHEDAWIVSLAIVVAGAMIGGM